MKKKIYVIMPFVSSPARNRSQLDSYFNNVIKKPLENIDVEGQLYEVSRSSNEFNITDSIILNIFESDILIADISGKQPNPNVMYELGLRLALSDKPTILIRENHPENRDVFDISQLHTFGYDPLDYTVLMDYLKAKVVSFEKNEEDYKSPILNVLSFDRPYFYRASEIQAKRKIDILYETTFGNIGIVFEKTLKSLNTKHPEEYAKARSRIFSKKGFMEQCSEFLGVMSELTFNDLESNVDGVTNQPLATYVQEFYLHQLIEYKTEKKINGCLVEYYRTFHSSVVFSDYEGRNGAIHFVAKSMRIIALISQIGVYLSLKNKSLRNETLEKINYMCDSYLEMLKFMDDLILQYIYEGPLDDKYE
ncbi:hypothetical protein [Methylomonas sp. MgM2]